MRIHIIVFLLVAIVHSTNTVVVHSTNTVAVLEIVPMGDVKFDVATSRYLTNELRSNARNVLPQVSYIILTRENILSLLPPDEKEAECLAEACTVDIGRAIGAEYITQGYVSKLGNLLALSVELYETMSGNLIGSFSAESKGVEGLLLAIREKSPAMFASIKTNVDLRKTKPDTNIPSTPSGPKNNAWIAVSLGALGVAALSIGIYNHINAKNLYNDYKAMEPGHDDSYYEPTRQEAKDAQNVGNIGYIVGSVLLASGIAIHIWF